MKLLNSRVFYCLIVFAAILAQFIIFPYCIFSDQGGPGDGLAFMFDLIVYLVLSVLIVIPLIILTWNYGFRGKRFGKTVLLLGLLSSEWLFLLFMICMGLSKIETTQSNNEDQSLLNRSSLVLLKETVLTNGKGPIGLHLDLRLNMPPEWGRKYPNCSGLNVEFPAINDTNSQLSFFNNHDTCQLSPHKTVYHVHHEADYYPRDVYLIEANKLCVSPLNQPSYNDYGFLKKQFTGAIEIEDSSYRGLTIRYPKDPVPASLKTEIINHLHLLRDTGFWNQVEHNLTDHSLQAAGYKKCPKEDRYSEHDTCFCKTHQQPKT